MDKAPDAFRTISEVADDLDIPQHVLRFWETRFAQIKPMKRSGGRRYYRPDDVDLLRGIRRLLYGEGYTIRGVQRILKEQGIKAVQALASAGAAPLPRGPAPALSHDTRRDADHDPRHAAFDADDDAELLLESGDADEEEDEPDLADEDVVVAPPLRREPVLHAAAPRAGRDQPARPAALADDGRRRRDHAKLRAVLQDLTDCRQLLDRALEASPPPLVD